MSATDNQNVNNSFFEGQYKDLWRLYIPEELTRRELDFILQYFNLQPGNKILDIMCGYGRHSLGLARKGMEVTSVDNLKDYVEEIQKIAADENLLLNAIQSDVLNFKSSEQFDLAICMGNSLNFFTPQDTSCILASISSSLKLGAHLLINTWSLAEIVIKNFKDKSWSTVGDLKLLADSKFLFHPTRIETQSIIISVDGKEEIKTGIDYIYSINEMEMMLKNVGLSVKEVYSIPGKKKFTIGEPRAYIIAQKFS